MDNIKIHYRFNELLLQGRAKLDTTKRREIYVDMQRIVNEEGSVCIPLFQSDEMAYNDKLAVLEVVGANCSNSGTH